MFSMLIALLAITLNLAYLDLFQQVKAKLPFPGYASTAILLRNPAKQA